MSDGSFRSEYRMQKLLKSNLNLSHHQLGTSPKKQRKKSISSQRSSNLEKFKGQCSLDVLHGHFVFHCACLCVGETQNSSFYHVK